MQSKVFVFCLVLAAAKGQIKDLTAYNLTVERSEDYINLNRLQHGRVIQDFDNAIENFKRSFMGQVDILHLLRTMTTHSIAKMEDRLNPLELMGDLSNKCVVKYRKTVPSVASIETAINSCISQATAAVAGMVAAPLNHRNAVQNLFNSNFEAQIKKCGQTYDKKSGNFTTCITTATASTNNDIAGYEKSFANYMDAAECTSKATLKKASDCTVTLHESTMAQITEANVLINNCLLGRDECQPCAGSCAATMDFEVDYGNETIPNFFYQQQGHKGCLLLKIKN